VQFYGERKCVKGLLAIIAALLLVSPAIAQERTLANNTPVGADVPAGGSRTYVLRAEAGDLVTGNFQFQGTDGYIEFVDGTGNRIRAFYVFDGKPRERQVGFVAPDTSSYKIRIIASKGQGTYVMKLQRTSVATRMQGIQAPENATPVSKRLQELAQQVERKDSDAVSRFWRERKGQGPLVETIDGDPDVLVTFLWKQQYDTRRVLLDFPLASYRTVHGEDSYMTRLPLTDVWFKSVRLRAGSLFTYGFSPNDQPESRQFAWALDSLNPRVYPDDPAYQFDRGSVLALPGGPDESWFRRTPPARGVTEQKRFKSTLLQNERDMWIYTPPGYTTDRGPYPLVILFDGAPYVGATFINAPTTLDNLIADRRIKPPIVCFVDSLNRRVDLGFGEAYGNAIVTELLPMLRSSYAISQRPEDTVIGGFSAGGLAGALIAFRHPEAFGNVLSQSGAFRLREDGAVEPNSIANLYAPAKRLQIRFYLEAGVYELLPSDAILVRDPAVDESFTGGNRHFRDVLIAKGYDVTYRETATAHENVHWRATLADALITLLGPR
jgi:enterochelin esterase family protein